MEYKTPLLGQKKYQTKVWRMSRTMKRVILKEEVSSGINASDKDLLQDEGFFDAWLEKSISQKDQVTFQGDSLHGKSYY